jgi:UDP-N-acetylmuramate--alanine ligase
MRLELEHHQLHFMGIGGAGMSGIARIALARNIAISGCDLSESATLDTLRNLGAEIEIGHDPEHISKLPNNSYLVLSTAVAEDNLEVKKAQNSGVKILHRSQVLAGLMKGFRSVAVAGTHGKTTTTSMLTVALQGAGEDPSFAIGGSINRGGFNGHQGSGDIFVAEADESDGSFTNYQPFGAIITNIELDHVDHFPNLESIKEIFGKFINSITPGGFLIINIDSPTALEVLDQFRREDLRYFTYGEAGDFHLSNISLNQTSSTARVIAYGRVVGEISLKVPGLHNLENALAAFIAGRELGIDERLFLESLENFTGARRRFEIKGKVKEITVIEDYAHHPTEITATLKAARQYAPNGRLIAVFQPHRYSRTQNFAKDFATSLMAADQVYLTEIYPASEAPIPGVSSELINQYGESNKIIYQPSLIKITEEIVNTAKAGDLVLLLGAGDVNSLAPVILQELENS